METSDAPLYVRTSGGNLRRANKPSKRTFIRIRGLVYERDEFTCQRCGYRPTDEQIDKCHPSGFSPYLLELDHVIPYKLGGQFTENNLQTLCSPCNNRKGAKV